MRFSQLAAQDPVTLGVARNVLGVTALETSVSSQESRLQDVEQAVAGMPSGPTLTITPTTVNLSEDTPVAGNVLANATSTAGTPRVLEYWVTGRVGTVSAGVGIDLTGVGAFQLYPDGEWGFEPLANYAGAVPVINFLVTNGSDIKVSYLTLSITSIDDAPIANTNSTMTAINQAVVINVLNNDYDAENQTITLTHVNGTLVVTGTPINVPNGVVTVDANSVLTFTPSTDYEGSTTFTYTISAGGLSSVGQVYVQVGYENIPLISPVSRIVEGDYFDEMHANFGNTAMGRVGELYNNGVNVTNATYGEAQGNFSLAAREPWLYDRATSVYKLYLRTQDPSILAKALEYAELYMSGVIQTFDSADFVTGGGVAGDPKYLYPIIAWWYERETGSSQFRAKARGLYVRARASFPSTYSSGAALWTERNMNYTLQACLAQYWLSGDEEALAFAVDYFETLISMSTASGAPLHPHGQHEGTGITTPITSPWMGAMLIETLVQLYRTNGDQRIIEWIARYCDFVLAHGFYTNHVLPGVLGLRVPAYLVGLLVQYPDENGAAGDAEHSYDIGIMLLKGIWAKQILSQDTTAMQQMANEQFVVARYVMEDWTRTTAGLPRYRVNPPRKFGWWFNGAYTKIIYAGAVSLGPISLTLPVISGSTPVGSLLTVTPGTYAGDPAPDVTHRWVHNAVVIPDETGLTYTTQESDEGAQISVEEIATNPGGTITRMPLLAIVPTGAGSPVITSQPVDVLVAEGEDALFEVTFTGAPAPTCQWYSYPSNTPVSGETGSTLNLNNVTIGQSNQRFYCKLSNPSGEVDTSVVTLYVAGQIDAVSFTSTEGAYMDNSLLPPGPANYTVECLLRMDGARQGDRALLTNRFIADRLASFGAANNWPVFDVSVGDSQTGWGAGMGTNPSPGEWMHVSISADQPVDAGMFRATLQALTSGSTQYSATRAKGFTGTLGHVGFELNGVRTPNKGLDSICFQYVRAYASERSLSEISGNRASTDLSNALFWWVFEDNGSGGVTVRDATGNGRVPTLVGGTLTTGPVVPVI